MYIEGGMWGRNRWKSVEFEVQRGCGARRSVELVAGCEGGSVEGWRE